MQFEPDRNSSLIHKSLTLFVLISQGWASGVGACADTPELNEQPPIVDVKPTQNPILKGEAVRFGHGSLDATIDNPAPNDDLQKLSAVRGNSPHVSLFGRKMSSEDYRSLEYGVLGIVSQKLWFGNKITVTEVLPNCPAALAGIRPGDVEVQANDHVWTHEDNQSTAWHIADGRAGTPVDVIIRRKRNLLTFHLIRMNIEDIQNDRIRRMYEKMLRKIGPP